MFRRLKASCGKRRRTIIVVSAALGLLWLGSHFWNCYREKDAAGVYLVDGGKYLIVLGHSPWKGLIHKEGYVRIVPFLPVMPYAGTSMVVGMTGSRLRLDQKHTAKDASYVGSVWLRLDLAPSSERQGDWDLLRAETGGSVRPRLSVTALLSFETWKDWFMPGEYPGAQFGTYDLADNPLKSYFHRIDDQRLCEYFKMRKESEPNKEQLDLIESIVRFHSGDPFLELHEIEMQALVGDADTAHSKLQDWKRRNPEDPTDPLSQSAHLVGNTVSLGVAEKRGYPKDSLRKVFTGTGRRPTTASWEERAEWLKKIVDYECLTPEVVPLIGDLWPDSSAEIPEFLEAQTALKRVFVTSIFELFRGNREESLALLAGSYRLGQSLNIGFPSISRSIGAAFRGIAISGLNVYVLNACETPEDFEECRKMLDRLYRAPYQSAYKYPTVHEFASFVNTEEGRALCPEIGWAEARFASGDARFELVRTALAAKYCLIRTNKFPEKDEDFAPFLEKGLPTDPFGARSIRYTLKDPDRFCVYSIGPDKDNDNAAVQYDPTNGLFSDGDIYLDIPREREFPFPRDGVKAKNAGELLAQFPNGLPMDHFGKSSYGKYPLSIIESSENTPVIVVSCGPDQSHPKAGNEAAFVPAGTTNEAFFRQNECVFLPVADGMLGVGSVAPGFWYIEAAYDPSNGTSSNGDIFMEVPR